ncbi:MAG: flagellar biosynthesis protein FlhB [Caulobacteraceae bacterium]|nr:flagellar biosynthesis protein FlhB [Caulobacteraceae bacterium]
MSDTSDASSKTEEATPRRLEEARRRGDVAKSPEVGQWASLAAASGVVAICGGWMAQDLAARLAPFLRHPDAYDLVNGGAVAVARAAMLAGAPIILAVMGAASLAGVAGNLIQTGFLFSPDKLRPDPSHLSPMEGFKRLFGIDGLVNFLKSGLKIGVVGVVTWMVMKPHVREFELLPTLEPMALLPMAAQLLRALLMAILGLLGVTALLDWFWQRQRFLQRMRMTKEEIKEDFKQSEGDPHVRARLRQIRFERSRRRMMQNVPKATVVVMNPTHYAVALRYVSGETAAPLCVAKGIDSLALKIREIAEEHKVAVVEDPPLARALYATVEIDQTIPREHYEAVAKVIGFIMQQARRRRARSLR